MMKFICKTLIVLIVAFAASCSNPIKNENPTIEVDSGVSISEQPAYVKDSLNAARIQDSIKQANLYRDTLVTAPEDSSLLGFWVGYFENDKEQSYKDEVFVDEGFYWNRQNKINLSIDKIEDTIVVGHSVVAGNERPFKGTRSLKGGVYSFKVKEPGNDKYDGEFTFEIDGEKLSGTWKAYGKIEIPKRRYKLEKKEFVYNKNIMLEETGENGQVRFIDWSKVKTKGYNSDLEYWEKRYASATNKIFKLNASSKLLKKEQVENLSAGDLLIIRNTIYARHGYSFKNRPLRVFFDMQKWYIPVYANIKDDFTEIEKKNIELLLQYEKNAKEYYDYFGRG